MVRPVGPSQHSEQPMKVSGPRPKQGPPNLGIKNGKDTPMPSPADLGSKLNPKATKAAFTKLKQGTRYSCENGIGGIMRYLSLLGAAHSMVELGSGAMNFVRSIAGVTGPETTMGITSSAAAMVSCLLLFAFIIPALIDKANRGRQQQHG